VSVDLFGQYQSQSTRQLAEISSSKYPDTNKDFEANLRRLNEFVDYIAQYLSIMQKGVDQANQDAISRLRDTVTNIGVLFGGGELLYGINLGDMQYFLPALGAIFGFDSSKPFPISLFEMAEHFLLGYVVPLDAWAEAIRDIINGWAAALGLDPDFITAVNEIFDQMIELGTTLGDILNTLWDLLSIFGINDGGFGPFADIWHVVTQLLGSFDLTTLGDIVDPVLHALAPWISELAQILSWVNQILQAFSGGLTDLQGVLNFASMFTPWIDFMHEVFDPVQAWIDMIVNNLVPDGGLLGNWSPVDALNLFNVPWLTALIPIGHIGNNREINLIDDPYFASATSVDSSVWTWDGTQKHSSTGGSAKVTADGTTKDLLSNRIPVDPGQTLKVYSWVKWAAMTGSGSPLKLGLTYYLDNAAVAQPDLVTHNLSPSTQDWTQFQATTVAPSNVDSVSLRLTVGSTATSGTVYWNDTWVSKPIKLLPTSFIDGLDDFFDTVSGNITTLFSNIVSKVEHSDFVALLNAIGGNIGSTISDIIDRLQDMLTPSSPLNANNINSGSLLDQFIPGISTILNNFVGGFRNVPIGSGFTHTDLAATAAAQAQALTGLAAQVSQINQTFTSGVTEGDDFERVSSTSLGSGWTFFKTGAGFMASPNGHDAAWIPSGNSDCEFVYIRNTGNIRSSTDFQSVEIVLASALTTSAEIILLQPLVFGANDLWCRISDGTTSFANITGIRYRFWQNGACSVWRYVNGVGTELTSAATGVIPGAGTVLGGLAGKAGTVRYFEPRLNYRPAIPGISEVGVASGIGNANHRWGFGGLVKGYNLPLPVSQTLIGSIRQWSAQDQFQ